MASLALRVSAFGLLALSGTAFLSAQAAPQPAKPVNNSVATDNAAAGDQPADPGPLATDLSPALTQKAIEAAMKKVGDWQVSSREDRFNRQWTFSALYRGLLAASDATGNPAYRDAVQRTAQKYDWKLEQSRFPHADDMALGWSYEVLAEQGKDMSRAADTKATL